MRKKTGYIQKRGTSFRIAYYVDHVRQFETFSTEEDAHRELAKRLAEVAQGIPVSSKPNTVKFGELCTDVVNDYTVNGLRSVDDIEARFRLHIVPYLGERKAAQITTAQLKSYIIKRQAQNASAGTINRELEAIRRALNLAIEGRKLLVKPHVPMLKENNVRAGFFTRQEVDKLCAHLKEPLSSFVLFAFLTGWRREEITNLRWRNIDEHAGEIRLDVGTTKSGEGRIFPIMGELQTLLAVLKLKATTAANKARTRVVPMKLKVVTANTGHVFRTLNGKPIGDFRKRWRTACSKAGLPVILDTKGKVVKAVRIFHDLRRSSARARQQEGFSEGQIMRMMGWKTRSVFDRYAIVTDEDIREKFRAINGAKSGILSQ